MSQPWRSFSPREARQQRADRLVSSRDELSTVLGAIAASGEGAVVRLAADIVVDRAIVLRGISSDFSGYRVTITGGGRYGFRATQGVAIFAAQPAVGTTSIAGLTFEDVSFAGDLASASGTATVIDAGLLEDVNLVRCRLNHIGSIATAGLWNDSTIDDVTVDSYTDAWGNLAFSSIASARYSGCYVGNVVRRTEFAGIATYAPAVVGNLAPISGTSPSTFIGVDATARQESEDVILSTSGDVARPSYLVGLRTRAAEIVNFDETLPGRTRRFVETTPTSNATTTTIATVSMPTDTCHLVEVRLAGISSAGDTAVQIRRFRVRNIAGTVTINGALADYTNQALAWPLLSEDVSGTSYRIRTTGAAATSITWTCEVTFTEARL